MFCVDADVALGFRQQVERNKRSAVINEFLRNFIDAKTNRESDEVRRHIEEANEERKKVFSRLQLLHAELAVITKTEEDAEADMLENASEIKGVLQNKLRELPD